MNERKQCWRLGLMLLAGCWMAAAACTAARAEDAPHMSLGLEAGWRMDRLDWNIASDLTGQTSPNIMSELRWRNIQSLQTAIRAEAEVRHVVFRGRIAYGAIGRGWNEDSDYAGNNRTLEFSRSRNDAGAGYTADATGGIGWRLGFFHAWSLTPLAGYAWHRQFLRMRNGIQVLSRVVTVNGVTFRAPPPGPFPGLDSRYIANWQGPWLGADVDWESETWHVRISGRFEWDRYRAEANWNLRADLAHPVSFRHRANGHGWLLGLTVEHDLGPQLQLGICAEMVRFDTSAGTDTTIPAGAGAGTVMRLNGVHWRAASAGARIGYSF